MGGGTRANWGSAVCWKERVLEGGGCAAPGVGGKDGGQQSREGLGGPARDPCAPNLSGTVCPSSSELSGWGLTVVDSSSGPGSHLCLSWVSGVINRESHLCGKQPLGIRAQGSSRVLCSPGAAEGITQRKTHERVSVDFQAAPTEQEGMNMHSRDTVEVLATAGGTWAGPSRSCACSSPWCRCSASSSSSSSVGHGKGAGGRAGAGWAVPVGALALGGGGGQVLGSVPLSAAAASFCPCISDTFNSGLKTQSRKGGGGGGAGVENGLCFV